MTAIVGSRIDGAAILPAPGATSCTFKRDGNDGATTIATLAGVRIAPCVSIAHLVSRVTIGAADGPTGGWVGSRSGCDWLSGLRSRVLRWLSGRGLICWLGSGLIGGCLRRILDERTNNRTD